MQHRFITLSLQIFVHRYMISRKAGPVHSHVRYIFCPTVLMKWLLAMMAMHRRPDSSHMVMTTPPHVTMCAHNHMYYAWHKQLVESLWNLHTTVSSHHRAHCSHLLPPLHPATLCRSVMPKSAPAMPADSVVMRYTTLQSLHMMPSLSDTSPCFLIWKS